MAPRSLVLLTALSALLAFWSITSVAAQGYCAAQDGAWTASGQIQFGAALNNAVAFDRPWLWGSDGFAMDFTVFNYTWNGTQDECCQQCCTRTIQDPVSPTGSFPCVKALYNKASRSCGILFTKSEGTSQWLIVNTGNASETVLSKCGPPLPPSPPSPPTARPPPLSSAPAVSSQLSPPPAPPAAVNGSQSTPADSAGGSTSTAAIAGGIAGGVFALLVLCTLALFLLYRRRKRSNSDLAAGKDLSVGKAEGLHYDNSSSNGPSSSSSGKTFGFRQSLLASNCESGSTLTHFGPSTANTHFALTTLNNLRTTRGEFDTTSLGVLQTQLDWLIRTRTALFDRYTLCDGHMERRVGGQGIVQFGTRSNNPKEMYALKFYLDREAFATEEAYFLNPQFEHILPVVDNVVNNANGAFCVLGKPLPPLVVIEKGESLDEYQRRAQPDFASTMHIMLHLIQRTMDIHNAGVVHRDLKPANVIYYPARNQWTIIDFGSAAPVGSVAPFSCTMAYAAPETVLAMLRGEKSVVADAAVDAWALGCIAWELFTRTRVFPSGSREQIEQTMQGEHLLPWENADDVDVETMRQLGFMKDGILAMLRRSPAERMSIHDVAATWRTVLQ